MIPKSIKMPGDGVVESALQTPPKISKEMTFEGGPLWDIESHLWRETGKALAAKAEEEIFSQVLGQPNKNGRVYPPEVVTNAMEAADVYGTPAISPLKVTERYGMGVLNSNGIASTHPISTGLDWKVDPSFTDVMIVRRFTEIGGQFSEDDLERMATDSVNKTFDIEWLRNKYPQTDDFQNYASIKDQVFVVDDAVVGEHEYAPNKLEKAVYATGRIIRNPALPKIFSRGKRGINQYQMHQQLFGQQSLQDVSDHVDKLLSEQLPEGPLGTIDSINYDPVTGNVNIHATKHQPIDKITMEINLKGENDK